MAGRAPVSRIAADAYQPRPPRQVFWNHRANARNPCWGVCGQPRPRQRLFLRASKTSLRGLIPDDRACNCRGKRSGVDDLVCGRKSNDPGVSNGGIAAVNLCSRNRRASAPRINYATPWYGHSRKAQRHGEIAEGRSRPSNKPVAIRAGWAHDWLTFATFRRVGLVAQVGHLPARNGYPEG
jgi:hypothetical protein